MTHYTTGINSNYYQPGSNDQERAQHGERRLGNRFRLRPMPVMIPKRLIVSDLDDPEKQNHIHKTTEQQRHHKTVMTGLNGAGDQIPFAKKTARRRNSNDGQCADHKGPHSERHFTKQPPHVFEGTSFYFVNNVTHNEEETECHQGIVYNVEDRSGHSGAISKPCAANHVTHLRNDDIGQHPL